MAYPDTIEIVPLQQPPGVAVQVPGSKSISNRALVLACLYSLFKPCRLVGALQSEDTEVMVAGLQKLGYAVQPNWTPYLPTITVGPMDVAIAGEPDLNRRPPFPGDLYVANSGTTMRFLTALASLGHGRFRIDGTARMRERPVEDLLIALRQVGVRASSEQGNGCPPVVVEAAGTWVGDRLSVRSDLSSQFLTAMLMVAPLACSGNEITMEIDGRLVSEPYIDMTFAMMTAWGLPIWRDGVNFRVGQVGAYGCSFDKVEYTIEPDASAASYFWAAAAVTGGHVTVPGIPRTSIQGDVRIVEVLQQMGCEAEREYGTATVHGAPLHGVNVDMNDISDTVMTLAAVACFAEGPTTIRNVAHIRHKETDRLTALATELRRVGADVEEFPDGLTITPRPLHGAVIETYNDHRMAMSMALIGLRVPGIVIKNPGCVAKTYPGFFDDLEKLRG